MPESTIPYVAVIVAMFAAFIGGFGYISVRELIDTRRETVLARRTPPAEAPEHMDLRRAA